MNEQTSVKKNMVNEVLKGIYWLGQSGFLINTEKKTIVIDPYQSEYSGLSDIILITHPHFDHLSIEDIDKFLKPSTVIITESQSAKKLSGNVQIIKPGDQVFIDNIIISAVRAYNINNDPHPKDNDWLGFILDIDGVIIYHSGDTDVIPEMKTITADIAMLPISGTYLMDVENAVKAVNIIKPKIAIPMHFNPNLSHHYKIFPGVGTKEDAIKFVNAIDNICLPIILPNTPNNSIMNG